MLALCLECSEVLRNENYLRRAEPRNYRKGCLQMEPNNFQHAWARIRARIVFLTCQSVLYLPQVLELYLWPEDIWKTIRRSETAKNVVPAVDNQYCDDDGGFKLLRTFDPLPLHPRSFHCLKHHHIILHCVTELVLHSKPCVCDYLACCLQLYANLRRLLGFSKWTWWVKRWWEQKFAKHSRWTRPIDF